MTAASTSPAAVAPRPVPMTRVVAASAVLVLVAAGLGQLLEGGVRAALLGAFAVLGLTFGTVFCVAAVTVTGFVAGAGAAGVVLLAPGGLVAVLATALLLALVCGVAPAWAQVESWQATRSPALSGGEPARAHGTLWRTDRVVAAFLVLAFPPGVTAAALAFVSWSLSR